ncbi:expressed unknown protein [Seminavis robusta]|uniref:Uncharacterized protein n=1 Tax=Seminavis robusta TaxID=568900 RepID=A0A9N8H5W9_9STRA|nr:expressed unknown protein [Seminavis robusta]|eukprot:Sro127_g060680.1 n/a (518) ;mRNA; f:5198-6751
MVSRSYDDAYYAALEYKQMLRQRSEDDYHGNMIASSHHRQRTRSPRQMRQFPSERSAAHGQYRRPAGASPPRLYPSCSQREWQPPLPYQRAYNDEETTEAPSFYGEVEAEEYYPRSRHEDDHMRRWAPMPQQPRRDYYESAYEEADRNRSQEEDRRSFMVREEEQLQRWSRRFAEEEEALRHYEEQNRAREEEHAEQERKMYQAREEEAARKAEEARKRELKREEEKRARQKKIAELMRPSGIPKPPPPPPELEHLLESPHWGADRAIKDAASPPPFIAERDISVRKGGSDHYSEISKASWHPPYPFSSYEENKERMPLHLCKKDDDSFQLDRKLSSHHSVSRKLPPSPTTTLKSGSASEVSFSLSYHQASSHGSRVGAYAERGDDDSYQLEKKLSSHHSACQKLPPPRSAASLKSDFSSNYEYAGYDSRVGAFAEKPQTSVLVEIQPGFSLPLRGSKETLQAVHDGRVLNTCCLSCCAALLVKDDCDFVICPGCRVVSPVEGGFGTMECVGLGMRS